MKFLMVSLLFSTIGLASEFDAPLKVRPFEHAWFNHPKANTIYKSKNYPKSVFLIEGYFYNCQACRDNAPNINRIAAHFKNNKRVQVLDVGRDCNPASYRAWVKYMRPNHPVLVDCDAKLLNQLGVSRYPTTAVLDCNLKVTKRSLGRTNVRSYIKHIEGLLKKGCDKK